MYALDARITLDRQAWHDIFAALRSRHLWTSLDNIPRGLSYHTLYTEYVEDVNVISLYLT